MIWFFCLQLILMSVLNCFYESVSQILRKNVEKRIVLDNLDIVMLAVDEICDGGFVYDNNQYLGASFISFLKLILII